MTPGTPRDGQGEVERHPSDCGCSPEWCKPKLNGTCATCGGWLPGERPASLAAMWTADHA